MIELRFRAWHKELKKMEYLGILNIMDMSYLPDYSYEQSWEEDDIDIMQWTGLEDKSGKDIYDGDILAVDVHLKRGMKQVVYRPSEFVVIGTKGIELLSSMERCDDRLLLLEVIGNIYQDSHLLKEEHA